MTATPGPWTVIELPGIHYRIDAKVGPLHVCPAIAHGSDDARLIAAAPDLLAALRGLLDLAGDGTEIVAEVRAARAAVVSLDAPLPGMNALNKKSDAEYVWATFQREMSRRYQKPERVGADAIRTAAMLLGIALEKRT